MSDAQDKEPTPTAPATKTDVQTVGFITSSTAFAVWLVKRLWFGDGDLPIEVSAVIQYGVPLAIGALSAEWRWLKAKRRTTPPAPPAG